MKKKIYAALAFALYATTFHAQQIYELSAPAKEKTIYTGHLKMGGSNPSGGNISVNSYYMSIDGKPVIPVMGEFHFTRYPRAQWEQEIVKMKAGGVNVLPTYIFWGLHEEEEGKFCWSGNKDLRHFIELCKKHDMPVIVRIGPFCHGEIRNGSIPDWLFARPVDVRSNQPLYLSYVKRLYGEIGRQLQGLYYKDGGPIIGCQLENEMQHSASPWGVNYPGEPLDFTVASYDIDYAMIGVSVMDKKVTTAELGEEHMRTLKKMAQEEGIITPFYTATGWGNAAVIDNEAIPVTSAYTYPFWEEPRMSPFCMFKDIHRVPDYAPVRYDAERFPSFCAEMGAGIQMIYRRRPIVTARAAQALMIRTLGSGSNGIGYYMYHGGSTPLRQDNIGSYQDEPMGMPKISYDFQAPLGEFGLEHPSYRYLRTIHSFLADFGSNLAPMETVLPEGWEKMTPENRDDLRYAARMKDDSGFIFMINFQDHDTLRHDMDGLQLQLNLRNETLRIPEQGTFTLPKDESMILPFNLMLGSARLRYATAQPLMKINDNGIDHYIFFAPEGMKPEYCFDARTVKGKAKYAVTSGLKSTITVTPRNGKKIKITTLNHEQALNAIKVDGQLLITTATVLPTAEGITLQQLGNNAFDYILYPSAKGWQSQTVQVQPVSPECRVEKITTRRITVAFSDTVHTPQVNEYFMKIDYTGDVAMAFLGGKMVQDEFWHAQPWMIGLNRHKEMMNKEAMSFYFRPLRSDATCLQDLPQSAIPDFKGNNQVLEIKNVEIIPQYQLRINN